jgi:PPOX class probable F420-dependent enzyme
MSTITTVASFDSLTSAKYVLLTTFRKDGTPVPTPLWHAVEGGLVYAATLDDTGKIKRIRNNRSVTIGACDIRGNPKGPTYAAVARVLHGEEGRYAAKLIESRYRTAAAMHIFQRLRHRRPMVGIVVAPEVDLP